MKNKKRISAISVVLLLVLFLYGCNGKNAEPASETGEVQVQSEEQLQNTAPENVNAALYHFDDASVPIYAGEASVTVNNGVPFFTMGDLTPESFEYYSDLDAIGRCGPAYACIGQDLMPTQERGDISSVNPTGWQETTYDDIDGEMLYNRCHLIGFQLTAEDANEKNLITGTRYFNVQGMLPYENQVAEYIKDTGNHVLYRVTPFFDGDNLVANGVLMEAYSVEDNGAGVNFCVYVYNMQPGVTIDYANGESTETAEELPEEPEPQPEEKQETTVEEAAQPEQIQSAEPAPETDTAQQNEPQPEEKQEVPAEEAVQPEQTQSVEPAPETANTTAAYILNTNTHKFHIPSCSSVDQMKESNKKAFNGTRDEAIAQGYDPCKRCNP